ncbi:MAG: L-threonylcarbamoyladenylate synthase [Candidatus Methanomethylophilaceae archaeon]|nr:L-threonylcarbamoyladenylate synthase [Candidatus Methanomethylophilaceae archaeon]
MRVIECSHDNQGSSINDAEIKSIVKELQQGELIVYPTETVYGIGADPFNENAVKKLYMAKKRPFDMPLSVAVSDVAMAERIAVLDDDARKLMDRFLPGPLTIIIKKRPEVPDITTAMSEKVGIRIPDHPLALRIIRDFGPLVATSANLHSHPDAVEYDSARRDLGSMVSTYLNCGPCPLGKPSTIVWMMNGEIEIVRQGAISKEAIEAVLNE